jgi:hypothetical protein
MPIKNHHFSTHFVITTHCPCWQRPHYEAEVAFCELLQIQEPDFYNRIFQLVPWRETSVNVFKENVENNDT